MTITLAFATGSTVKYRIAAQHLAPYGITLTHAPIPLPELQSDDVTEIAAFKARHAYTTLGRPVIVEDSGFALTELGTGNYPLVSQQRLRPNWADRAMGWLSVSTPIRTLCKWCCDVTVDARLPLGQVVEELLIQAGLHTVRRASTAMEGT